MTNSPESEVVEQASLATVWKFEADDEDYPFAVSMTISDDSDGGQVSLIMAADPSREIIRMPISLLNPLVQMLKKAYERTPEGSQLFRMFEPMGGDNAGTATEY